MSNNCLIQHKPQPHDHPQRPDEKQRDRAIQRLKITFVIVLAFIAVELVGAWISGSLALFADAIHMTADSIAIGMTLLASYLSERPPSSTKSYGYYRLEVLAALANGLLLTGMAVFILLEALERWGSDHEVQGEVMLITGGIGLLANILMLFVIKPAHSHNLNLKGAFLHIVGDTLASVAVVIGAVFIIVYEQSWPDLVASFIVVIMITVMSLRLIRDSSNVLLEGSPKHMDPQKIKDELISEFPIIKSIHDFHLWEITSHLFAMTAHIEAEVENHQQTRELIDAINERIRERYGIGHTTFQVEPYRRSESTT